MNRSVIKTAATSLLVAALAGCASAPCRISEKARVEFAHGNGSEPPLIRWMAIVGEDTLRLEYIGRRLVCRRAKKDDVALLVREIEAQRQILEKYDSERHFDVGDIEELQIHFEGKVFRVFLEGRHQTPELKPLLVRIDGLYSKYYGKKYQLNLAGSLPGR